MIHVRVAQGVEDKLRSGFPWVYKQEIISYSKKPQKGELVVVRDYAGKFIGYGYINPDSTITVRILSFDKERKISERLVRERIQKAYEYRKKLSINSNAYRLIHSEGDFLPGLVVDVYDRYLVVEFTTYGMHTLRDWVINALIDILKPEGIYEKVSDSAKYIEGIPAEEGTIYGYVPEEVIIWEHDLKFIVNIPRGQKTGFFLDQRYARKMIRSLVKPGDRCLDVFCHTGGFALSMKKAGAGEVIGVDLSEGAIETAKRNAEINSLEGIQWVVDNAFDFLKRMHQEGQKFDIVVIDPPSFAKNKAAVPNAMRGYKELALRGLHITKPGGYLAVYSCSFHITRDHLLKALLDAAKDAKKIVRVVGESIQDLDHPWILQMPNTLYLKGVYVEVL
ncbi:class I SAM-dependent rRNA methyltransferase [Thermocrinis minervae]|uniref:23S rRNA (Cytosine1962-C5)-methyltransferase n=1 Tax=Thermocrinis minervae TaxID=381751 RepID=A0A1M6Q886_9AQUI|nr:class I SAM-dependent rRNA methyltransferase [Thermocrinis minervae]SHK16411.1 23S rRNA (cytosine1962-C5)-methyltransferase [Thermocrinis minervae]